MLRIYSGARRRRGRRTVSQVLAVLLLIACSWSDGSADIRPKTHSVAIQGFEYRPTNLTVTVGDTVVWTNKDVVPHTATAEGDFDSGSIGANQSWRYVAGKKGTYAYDCTFHPTMRGTLVVR